MERRSATRKLTETKVVVHYDGFAQVPLKTRDMSQSGVFVTTKTPVNLTPGTSFEVTFMIDLGSITKLRKVKAEVVDTTAQGMRLKFQ